MKSLFNSCRVSVECPSCRVRSAASFKFRSHPDGLSTVRLVCSCGCYSVLGLTYGLPVFPIPF